MPTYVYEVVHSNGAPGERFEVVQTMSESPLEVHPESGLPVRRVFLPPMVGGRWGDEAMARGANDDKKLERLGFTKYVKSGDGTYEKTVGFGPKTISRDNPAVGGDF
jgi:hypothetical protein